MTAPPFLPYGRQTVTEEDIAAVTAVLRGDWLTQGPMVEAFERGVADRVGAAHAVACANGTAALHLACLALRLEPGDAVVVPSITFLATASAARHAGAEVAFADVDPATGLTTAAHVGAAMDRAAAAGWRVRAIAPVHFAGQAVDMEALAALVAERAERDGPVAIVEDACHALGTTLRHGTGEAAVGACSAGTMTAFSFHPVKTVAAGEGGMVTTNDPALAERMRVLRNHGMVRPDNAAPGLQPGPWHYEMAEPGFNYRLTDIQSALGLSQLARLDALAARRAALMERYARLLAQLAPHVVPLARVPWCRPAWHLAVVLVDFARLGTDRARVMEALRARGIGTQLHYIPVHRQPYWQERYGDPGLPGAERWYARALTLPLFPAMADEDVDRVVDALAAVLGLASPS